MEKIFSKMQYLIGGVAILCLQSSVHARYSIGFMLNRWRKPVLEGSYTYVEELSEDGVYATPLQFMSWIFVSTAWVEELRHSNSELEYVGQQVETGPYIFILDVISPTINPFHMVRGVINKIRQNSKNLKGVVYIRIIGEKRKIFVHDFLIKEARISALPAA
jgi:hemolysin-activating ACP:hemolysin acyltransferase